VLAERYFANSLKEFAEFAKVPVLNAKKEQLKAFTSGANLYPPDLDSHPNAEGYVAYATAAAQLLKHTQCPN